MYKKIFNSLIAIGLPLLFATCTQSTDFNPSASYGSTVDLTGSTLSGDQNNTSLYYSTDNGVTFVPYPALKVGQKFQVKVVDTKLNKGAGYFLTNTTSNGTSIPFFSFDWSASTPAPTSGTSDIAEFTYTGSNKISVKIIDMHCATDLTKYIGGWNVDEGTSIEVDSSDVKISGLKGGTYIVGLSQDTQDATKVWMYNVRGLGLNAYMNFSTSTSYWDQNVTMPSQPIGTHGATIKGSGTYDQCRMQLSLNVVYSFVDTVSLPIDTTIVKIDKTFKSGDSTLIVHNYPDTTITPAYVVHIPYQYKWTYTFDKPAPYCAYDPSSWTGARTASIQQYSEDDSENITVDGSNPNKFWMDNVWGDGGSAYFIMSPSTNYFDQFVTVPQQNVTDKAEGPATISGSGVYDQCSGIITMGVTYTILPGGKHPGDAGTYSWTYLIHK